MQLDNPDAVFCGTLDIPSDLIHRTIISSFLGYCYEALPNHRPFLRHGNPDPPQAILRARHVAGLRSRGGVEIGVFITQKGSSIPHGDNQHSATRALYR